MRSVNQGRLNDLGQSSKSQSIDLLISSQSYCGF